MGEEAPHSGEYPPLPLAVWAAVSEAIENQGLVVVTTERHGALVNACMKARGILSYADRNDEAVSKAFDVLNEVLFDA